MGNYPSAPRMTSQKSENLIYTAAEAWNHASRVFRLVDRWRAVPLCSDQAVQEDSLDCLTPNVKVLFSFETLLFASIHGVTPPENMDLQQHRWENSKIFAPLAPCTTDVPSAVVCHSFFAWSSSKSVTVSSSHSRGLSKCFLSHPCWPTFLTCTCHSASSVSCLFRVITSETVNYLHIEYISWTRGIVRLSFDVRNAFW